MNLKDFANETNKTWRYSLSSNIEEKDAELLYLGNCLAGEVGELTNIFKKFFQKKYLGGTRLNHSEEEIANMIKDEIGDSFYYLFRICLTLGFDPDEIWQKVMGKNTKRYVSQSE